MLGSVSVLLLACSSAEKPDRLQRTFEEAALVRATDLVRCMPAGGLKKEPGQSPEPHLLVWYVPAPESVSEASVPPEVAERPKALGYTW